MVKNTNQNDKKVSETDE